jgi:hypothetical protein
MVERLTALFAAGRITAAQVNAAADRGWITTEQAAAITEPEEV